MNNRIALAGCGNVGTALLEILQEKQNYWLVKFQKIIDLDVN